jgi:hypothetical protein
VAEGGGGGADSDRNVIGVIILKPQREMQGKANTILTKNLTLTYFANEINLCF